jgi:hypothetical protein
VSLLIFFIKGGNNLKLRLTFSHWDLSVIKVDKSSGQSLGLIVMSYWLCEIWIWTRDSFVYFTFIFVSFEESCLLVSWCAVAGAAWHTVMRIMVEVGDLVQRTQDGHTCWVLGGRAIERSGGAVCSLHRARGDNKREFLGWASKPRSAIYHWFGLKTIEMVCQWFGLKIIGTVFSVWSQNRWRRFLPVWPQN